MQSSNATLVLVSLIHFTQIIWWKNLTQFSKRLSGFQHHWLDNMCGCWLRSNWMHLHSVPMSHTHTHTLSWVLLSPPIRSIAAPVWQTLLWHCSPCLSVSFWHTRVPRGDRHITSPVDHSMWHTVGTPPLTGETAKIVRKYKGNWDFLSGFLSISRTAWRTNKKNTKFPWRGLLWKRISKR